MPLTPGTTLGPYRVTAKIGEGGMGEVYRARDTKLDRDVALKVLPEAFTQDPDRLARFEREAKVLASLNHPNIAAIYGLEESDGIRALVLELVEGPTLADRIKQGPIPLDEALPIAKQIAEALEAAHEAGVIHRDLKPANIKARDDGTVKVLDFGLAKALDPNPEGDPSQSPTLTAAATQMGVIMGTAAYMSPEQAAGKPTDKRGDIWSFGVVLFEMLTGERLFTGETVSHVLAKVLDRELDLSALPAATPAPLRLLLRRCLERKPRRRLADPGEALFHLEEAAEPVSEGNPAATISGDPPVGWQRLLLPVVGGSAVVAIVTGLTVWSLMRPAAEPPPSPTRFAVELPLGVRAQNLVLSPDGRTIAFGGVRPGEGHVFIRSLSELDIVPLRGGENSYPSGGISPDGQFLLATDFTLAPRTLKRVPLAGGPGTPIADDPNGGATWGPDNTIVQGAVSGLLRIAASGGDPTQLTTVADGETGHALPRFLPNGRAVLFQIMSGGRDTAQVGVYDFESDEWRGVLAGASPQYALSGHLVFWRDESLWAVPFDLDHLEVRGNPILVVQGVQANLLGVASYAVGTDGTLVYVPVAEEGVDLRSLVWVDRSGVEEPLSFESRPYSDLQLSPDGRQVVTEVRDPDNTDIWIYDLERDTSTRFTFDPARDLWPVWTPDGERVVFASTRDGGIQNLHWKAANGIGPVERLTTSESVQAPHSFAADGRLVFGDDPQDTLVDLAVLSMEGDYPAETLVQTDFRDANGDVSPDGRWLAYVSDESGEEEIYVRPFPNVDDGRWQISRDGGSKPVWGPDSRELFYITSDAPDAPVTMMIAVNDTDPTFSPGNSVPLFSGPYLPSNRGRHHVFDISPDGQRFLMIKQDTTSESPPIIVVQNWTEELKRLVPTN